MLTPELKFQANLSLVLAHTIWYERQDPELVVFEPGYPRNGGNAPTGISGVSDALYQQLAANLPQIISEVNAGASPTAAANLQAAQETTPGYNQLGLTTLQQYLPQYAQVGSNVAGQEQQAQTAQDLASIQGTGGQAATAATELQNRLNPETTAVRAATAKGLGDLLGSINLSGLSGGEQAAVERANAQGDLQTGNTGNNNTVNALKNASNFGNALQEKRAALSSALAQATSFLPNSTTGVNTVGIATGRPGANSGTSQFSAAPSAASAIPAAVGQTAGFIAPALGAQTGLINNVGQLQGSQYQNSQSSAIMGNIPT